MMIPPPPPLVDPELVIAVMAGDIDGLQRPILITCHSGASN